MYDLQVNELCYHVSLFSSDKSGLIISPQGGEESPPPEKERADREDSEKSHSASVPHSAEGPNDDLYAIPVKLRPKKEPQLPPGWEKHEGRIQIMKFIYFIKQNILFCGRLELNSNGLYKRAQSNVQPSVKLVLVASIVPLIKTPLL